MKSLSYFDIAISSQVASGNYETARDLREVYTKVNLSLYDKVWYKRWDIER